MSGFQGSNGFQRASVMVCISLYECTEGLTFWSVKKFSHSTYPLFWIWNGMDFKFSTCVVFKESHRCHTSVLSPLLAIADSEGSITLHQWREVDLNIIHHPWLSFVWWIFLCSNISLNSTQYDVHLQILYAFLWTGPIGKQGERKSNLFSFPDPRV